MTGGAAAAGAEGGVCAGAGAGGDVGPAASDGREGGGVGMKDAAIPWHGGAAVLPRSSCGTSGRASSDMKP
eukprot:986766-Pleurochrysis_carterae.AAC.1